MTEIYCLKCKKRVENKDKEVVVTYNTKRGIKYGITSICPICGNKLSKMTKKPENGLQN